MNVLKCPALVLSSRQKSDLFPSLHYLGSASAIAHYTVLHVMSLKIIQVTQSESRKLKDFFHFPYSSTLNCKFLTYFCIGLICWKKLWNHLGLQCLFYCPSSFSVLSLLVTLLLMKPLSQKAIIYIHVLLFLQECKSMQGTKWPKSTFSEALWLGVQVF